MTQEGELMQWSVWWSDRFECYNFVQGLTQPVAEPDAKLLTVFEATSYNDACQQYHKWQGWEPYKPMESVQ